MKSGKEREERTNREKLAARIKLMRLAIMGFREGRKLTVSRGKVRPRKRRRSAARKRK